MLSAPLSSMNVYVSKNYSFLPLFDPKNKCRSIISALLVKKKKYQKNIIQNSPSTTPRRHSAHRTTAALSSANYCCKQLVITLSAKKFQQFTCCIGTDNFHRQEQVNGLIVLWRHSSHNFVFFCLRFDERALINSELHDSRKLLVNTRQHKQEWFLGRTTCS